MEGVTPPGMEHVVLRLKKNKNISNPWAIAWSLYNKKGKAAAQVTDSELESEVETFMEESSRIKASRPTPAEAIKTEVEYALQTGSKSGKTVLDYVEVPGGTRCGTCVYAQRLDPEKTGWNEDIADCVIMFGKISLKDGCCAAWKGDPEQLTQISE